MAGPLLRFLVDELERKPEDLDTLTQFIEAARAHISAVSVAEDEDKKDMTKRAGDVLRRVSAKGISNKKAAAVQHMKKSAWGALKTAASEKMELIFAQKVKNILEKVMKEARCESVLLIPTDSVVSVKEAEKVTMRCVGESTSRWKSGDPKNGTHGDWLLKEGYPAGLCVATKQIVIVDNIFSDRRNFKVSGLDFGAISQLCSPIFGSDGTTVVGVLKLLNKQSPRGGLSGVPFDPGADEAMAAIYSKVLGTAVREGTAARRKSQTNCLLASVMSAAKDTSKLKSSLNAQAMDIPHGASTSSSPPPVKSPAVAGGLFGRKMSGIDLSKMPAIEVPIDQVQAVVDAYPVKCKKGKTMSAFRVSVVKDRTAKRSGEQPARGGVPVVESPKGSNKR